MKILLANHTPLYGSGSGIYIAMLARELMLQGHDICLLTPLDKKQATFKKNLLLCYVNLGEKFPSFTGHPSSVLTYDKLTQHELNELHKSWKDAFSDIKKRWKPDIVHVQHVWVLAKAAIDAGLTPIVTCHGSEVDFSFKHPDVAKYLLPKSSQLEVVISISDYVSKKASPIIQNAVIKKVLSNPYNERLFYYEQDKRTSISTHFGFVGRLVTYKNCQFFLESMLALKKIFPELRATIIGEGAERISLEQLTEELDLVNVVEFLGQLDQKFLRHYYHQFDALIVPSNCEPFGLVALEAVACGTPAIVSKCGGLAELVNPPYIYGYQHNELNELITVIKRIISRSQDVKFHRRANQYVKQRYSLTEYIYQLEALYTMTI
jgi:glycosyltransferase involved in cell wall biosynthesis